MSPSDKAPSRASRPDGPRGAGSKSPKHRGHRPDEAEAPRQKKRWDSAERGRREFGTRAPGAPRDGDRRPNFEPRKPTGGRFADRFGDRDRRDDRNGARGASRDERSYGRDDRPQRGYGRDDRGPQRDDRGGRDDRPQRGYGRDDRPQRGYGRDDRPQRGYGRDDRAPQRGYGRDDRGPQRDDRGGRDDRPQRGYGRDDRPQRGYGRDDRPQRGNGRDDRAPQRDDRGGRDERPQRGYGRTERPQGGFVREDRPQRGFVRDDRAPRRDERDDRAPRRDERTDRAPRRDERTDRAPRRDDRGGASSSGRGSGQAWSPEADVKLEKLQAEVLTASDVEGVSFGDLGLGQNIVRQLAELGAEAPFPIQAATIPDVIAGRDVLGRGRTGSGKTIAFGAPLVEKLMEHGGGAKRAMGRAPRALILAPTRELALQIDRTVQPIARSVGLFTTQVYGGVPQGRQVGALQRGVDIVIGTPGRIEDLVEQGRLDLSEVVVTVLDEADHMCDLGFLEPVQRIIRRTADVTPQGARAQKLLFSATLDRGVATLVDEFLVEPAVHEVAGEDQASATIDHRVLLIEQRDKAAIIEELSAGPGKTLVFARTRAFAEQLADQLEDAGIRATSLHGDLNQARRTRNLQLLTSGRVDVLVATDVAARGIHVDDIELVVQADMPDEYKTYLHRAGRTGRAGKQGTVVTLITRARRRRMEDLLDRAEITADFEETRPGDAVLGTLAGTRR
ncbi:DEAD/DEAH box helicase [Frigoribacterium salinisoli]